MLPDRSVLDEDRIGLIFFLCCLKIKTMRLLLLLILGSSFTFLNAQNGMFDICPLKVGSDIPAVAITDAEHETYQLTDLVSEKPSVLIFYRGAWCGYCTQHLAELNDIKGDIEALGYQVFGITIDKAEKLEESTKRSESEITVYSDASADAVRAFGLDWQVEDELFNKYKDKYNLDLETWSGQDHHTLPVPAVFVVKEGKVQFQYVNPNYNTRLKPATLLAVLKTI